MKKHSTQTYFSRDLEEPLKKISKSFKVIAVLAPRQSGKTTLIQNIFTDHTFILLEDLDTKSYTKTNTRNFLAQQDS